MEFIHQPVLLKETLDLLQVSSNGTYIDCTVGGGGHSLAIASRLSSQGRLVGLDQDPGAIKAAGARLQGLKAEVNLIQSNFSRLEEVLRDARIEAVDGIIFDLGVSSPQLDQSERGFSYMQDAPLDMRMDPGQKWTAADLVNTATEDELTRVIREYGEDRWARRIAEFIVRARQIAPVSTTGDLVEIIKSAIPASARRTGPHPAKRTFQALRIAINHELEYLKDGIVQAVAALRPGGRICVIAFHSLEDRIVKQSFKNMSLDCVCPPGFPECRCGVQPLLKTITRKPVTPSPDELNANPRSRSALLRVAEKLHQGDAGSKPEGR
ncbi:MAG: 16S rRNA (cytosine(1402)-N(4))-methyltransferase RsmH [Bacillota bacterium]